MVIILDLGGVLMNHNMPECLARFEQLLGKDKMMQVLGLQSNAEGREDSIVDRYEKGNISTDAFIETILSHARPDATREEVIAAWNSMHGGIPEERLALIRKWKDAGHHLYMLSNNNDLHWHHVFDNYDLSMFDHCYASHLLHLAKPDIRIYQTVDAEIRKTEEAYKEEIQKPEEAYKEEIQKPEEAYKEERQKPEEAYKEEIRKPEEAYKEEIRKPEGENNVFCFVDDLEANRLAAARLGWRPFPTLSSLAPYIK